MYYYPTAPLVSGVQNNIGTFGPTNNVTIGNFSNQNVVNNFAFSGYPYPMPQLVSCACPQPRVIECPQQEVAPKFKFPKWDFIPFDEITPPADPPDEPDPPGDPGDPPFEGFRKGLKLGGIGKLLNPRLDFPNKLINPITSASIFKIQTLINSLELPQVNSEKFQNLLKQLELEKQTQ